MNKLERCTGLALVVYVNKHDEINEPIILPKENAKYLAWDLKEAVTRDRRRQQRS